ncbi:unnamed protein product [Amaranthus hypochondriacus]
MDKKVNDSATMAASLPFSEMLSLTYSLTSLVDDQRRRNKKVMAYFFFPDFLLFQLRLLQPVSVGDFLEQLQSGLSLSLLCCFWEPWTAGAASRAPTLLLCETMLLVFEAVGAVAWCG